MSRNLKVLFGAFALSVAAASARADIAEEPLVNPADETDVWGEKITGLGDNGDETALVFTKTGETMNWTLEKGVNSIWYLVAGGGGSGGASAGLIKNGTTQNKYYASGGGGAGGFCEVTEYYIDSPSLEIVVGAGGEAVSATVEPTVNHSAAGKDGGNSSLTVGTMDAVIAYGGGGGGAIASGRAGGSGGGSGVAYSGTFSGGACVAGQGNVGGSCSKREMGAAGGGGAGGAAPNKTSGSTGGKGGAGLQSDITGVSSWYCAGGGGGGYGSSGAAGAGGEGGGGAGSKYGADKDVTAGSATTYGSGGGGTCGYTDVNKQYLTTRTSGAGYQGVVIVRYKVLAADVVEVPTIAGVDYNGELQKAVVPASDGYTVTKNDGGVDAGDYDVVLTLVEGYKWYDGSTEPKTLTFTISKIANGWQREPSLSKGEWQYLDEAATVDFGLSLSGEAATVTYDEGETTMPETVGSHMAVFMVAESANYKALSKTIPYTIKPRTNTWVTEPSITPAKWAIDESAGTVASGEAESGVEVVVTYDEGQTEMPTAVGVHTAVFTVAASENYTSLKKELPFEITKKVNGWTSAPVVEPTRYTPDSLPSFTPPTAVYGDVVRYFDGDPENTEVPTSMGKHTVTYAVAEGDDYQAFEQTIELTVLDVATLGVAQVVLSGYDGTVSLTNFPALVRFSADNIEGLNADLLSEDGSDVRVYGEDGEELPFEIESWDRTGESLIWVKIPELVPTSEKLTSVFVKWSATEARTTEPKDVWTEYLAVWHMNGTTIVDATGNGTELTGTSLKLIDGMVGKALLASKGLAMSENFAVDYPDYAVSCWYRYGSSAQVTPLSRGGWQKDGWYLEYKSSTTEMNYIINSSKKAVTTLDMVKNWNHVSVSLVGGVLTGYMNGTTKTAPTTRVTEAAKNLSVLGSNGDGRVDELRIHKGGESTAWAKADYLAQTGDLVTYALVQNPQLEDVIVVPSETPPVVDNERTLTIGYRVSSTGGSTVTVSALYAMEGADTTNETAIGSSSVVQTEDAFGKVEDLKPGTSYWVALYGKNASDVESETTAWQKVTVPGPVAIKNMVLSQTKATATITGVITGLGTKTAKLKYAFGKDEMTEIDLVLDDDGAFTVTLDRVSVADVLTYQVVADNTLSTTTWGDFAWSAETEVKDSKDSVAVTYTWTGAVSDEWADPENWTASVASSFGFPNDATYATAHFTKPAAVDLRGNSYSVKDITFANKATAKLMNGSFDVYTESACENGTLEAENVRVTYHRYLSAQDGHTVILEGNSYLNYYRPWNAKNGTLLVRNGESTIGSFEGYCKTSEGTDNNWFEVSNAVLTVTGAGAAGGRPLVIRNGAERQGRVLYTKTDGTDINYYRYDFEVPASGLRQPAIDIKKMNGFRSYIANEKNVPPRITVDVTQFERGKRVPLLHYGTTSLAALPNVELTTIPAAAKAERNARLYWEDNTLWYKQDGKFGFTVIVK